ncbi:MAG: FecR domain-containing protein [Bacteroidales bacterium]|nr:FecR domain-containing protein [Bacteroidales bacterium]
MNIVKRIITLYSANDMPDDVVGSFFEWMADDRNKKQKYKELKALWNRLETGDTVSGKNVEDKLKELHKLAGMKGPGRNRFPLWLAASVAAGLLLLLGTGLGIYVGGRREQPAPERTQVRYLTADAKTNFSLPDGTKVWLNAGSSLSFSQEEFMSSGVRSVSIDGEGFFDVAKNGEPFLVDFGSSKVKVTGTRFMVRHYGRNADDLVLLESGSVEVVTPAATVPLSPGQVMTLERSSGRISVSDEDMRFLTNWMDQTLSLKQVELKDLLKSISHRYNVDIEMAPDYSYHKRISMEIKNETLDQALNIISIITGCKVFYKGEYTILITK